MWLKSLMLFLALISKSISAWLISFQFLTMLLTPRHFLYWLNTFFKLSSQASFMYGYFFQFSLKPFFTPFFPPSVFLGPEFCWLEDSPVEFRAHLLFCSPNSKSLDMIQLISLTGTFTLIQFTKKPTNQKKNKKKHPKKNQTPKQSN